MFKNRSDPILAKTRIIRVMAHRVQLGERNGQNFVSTGKRAVIIKSNAYQFVDWSVASTKISINME